MGIGVVLDWVSGGGPAASILRSARLFPLRICVGPIGCAEAKGRGTDGRILRSDRPCRGHGLSSTVSCRAGGTSGARGSVETTERALCYHGVARRSRKAGARGGRRPQRALQPLTCIRCQNASCVYLWRRVPSVESIEFSNALNANRVTGWGAGVESSGLSTDCD